MIEQSESFDEGYKSFLDGKLPRDNPYHIGTSDHGDWRTGWITARADALRGQYVTTGGEA